MSTTDAVLVAALDQLHATDSEILDCMVKIYGRDPDFQGSLNFLKLVHTIGLDIAAQATASPETVVYELLALAIRRLGGAA